MYEEWEKQTKNNIRNKHVFQIKNYCRNNMR